MEQGGDWSLLDEIDEDGPITWAASQSVRDHSAPGCLICVLEEWDDE